MDKELESTEPDLDLLAIDYLRPLERTGTGELRHGAELHPASFKLIEFPEYIEFDFDGLSTKACYQAFSNDGDDWSLSGKLDDGRPVYCDKVYARSMGVFFASAQVHVGCRPDVPPQDIAYSLVGFYEGKISLHCDGWRIETTPEKHLSDFAKHLRRGWGIVAEGLWVTLSCEGADLEEYEIKIRQITDLLSLACGTGITYHRSRTNWATGESLEIIRRGVRDSIGSGECMLSCEISRFLESALPIWGSWTPEMQKICRLIIDYLSVTGKGYLDTRIMTAWQAWELAASAWGPPLQITAQENALKRSVLKTCSEWRKANPELDPDGHWSNRLAFSFKWPAALRQIEALVDAHKIDYEKIGLDFKLLKYIRDCVVHNGKLPSEANENRTQTYRLMESALFGLQLVLLVELGYDGRVAWHENGSCIYPYISEFFRQA